MLKKKSVDVSKLEEERKKTTNINIHYFVMGVVWHHIHDK